MVFSDALDGYWLERRRDLSPRTVEQYQYFFDYLVEYTGDIEIEEINSDKLRGWLNWLGNEKKLSGKTISNAWVTLSAFFTWAEADLKIEHPIRGRIAAPAVPPPKIDYYKQTDIMAMMQACGRDSLRTRANGTAFQSLRPTAARDRSIIATLLDTGLRASELCELQMCDYSKDSGQIIVRKGKGAKFRVVYLGRSAQRYLWKYLTTRKNRGPQEPLFSSAKGDVENRLDRTTLRATMRRIGDRAGVTGVNLHRFRHTFAINFLRNGGSPLELKELLGHSKLETVLIYVRLAQVDLQEAQRIASPADKWNL